MPRTKTTLVQPELDELEADVAPVTPILRRGPGRPRKTTAPAVKRTPGRPGRKPGDGSIAARNATTGKIMGEAEMKARVAAQLGMLLGLGVAAVEFRDPDMAQAFIEPINVPGAGELDPIEALVDRAVNLLARNKKWLATAAKGDLLMDAGALAFIVGTLVKRCYTIATSRPREDSYNDDGAYPAYTGAGHVA